MVRPSTSNRKPKVMLPPTQRQRELFDRDATACWDARHRGGDVFKTQTEALTKRLRHLDYPRGRDFVDLCSAYSMIYTTEAKAALLICEEVFVKAKAGQDHTLALIALQVTSMAHYMLEQYELAIDYLEQAMAYNDSIAHLLTRKEVLSRRSKNLNNLGVLESTMGHLARAYERHLDAESIARENDDDLNVLLNATNRGYLLGELGRFPESIAVIQDAIALCRRLDHEELLSVNLVNYVIPLLELGSVDQAAEMNTEAMAMVLRRGDLEQVADAWLNSALIDRARGHREPMLPSLRTALSIAKQAGSVKHEIRIRQVLAETLERLDETSDAVENLREALDQVREANRLWRLQRDNESERILRTLMVQRDVERAREETENQRRRADDLNKLVLALQESDVRNAQLLVESERSKQALEVAARTDILTGLNNRRYLESTLEREYARALRGDLVLSVALLDVDHFKKVNDSFGHATGDDVLRTVAQVMKAAARSEDMVARYGGEEFVIVLIGGTLQQAAMACDRIRMAIEAYDWTSIHADLAVTASMGVATGVEFPSFEGLINLADNRLYQAKKAGRNRVVAA